MKKIFLGALLSICLVCFIACGGEKQEVIEKTEKTEKTEIHLPEWAKSIKPSKEIDKYYMPKYLRNGYTMDEVRDIYGEYVYLLETYPEYSEENPNYYGRLYYLGLYGVNIGTYDTSIQIANIFKTLPKDQIFYKKMKNGKEKVKTIGDYPYETFVAPFEFVALYKSGKTEEAMKLYQEVIKPNLKETLPWHTHTIAKILEERGDIEGAEEIYNEMTSYEGKKRSYLYAAGCLEACSYYFKKGDYDKVIEMADVYLALGPDPEKAAKILYPDKSIHKIFKDHWLTAYTSLSKYKELAIAAKNGETIRMDELKDGVYTHANRSLRGTPFEITLTIENGKIVNIQAVQNPTGDQIYDDRAFAAKEIMTNRILEAQDYSVDAIASATMASTSIRLGVMEGLVEASK